MGKLFGTDGVRGVANKEITGELAYKLGRAGGYLITRDYNGKGKPVMLIGKDTRISGDMLESALVAGMTSAGIDVIRLGVIPTPGVAYLTTNKDVQGGVMISASHNPIADNGIKFFDGDGNKLTDKMEDEIEDFIFHHYGQIPFPTHEEVGMADDNKNLLEEYIDYLVGSVDTDFSSQKIVLDCANGAAYQVAPAVLKALKAEVIVINDHPDGSKINVECGSTHPEILQEEVLKHGANLGIAHDGDADRVVLVDEKGQILDGDSVMAVLALDLLKRGKLQGNTLVTTAYSNLGLKEVIEEAGGQIAITDNGDRYVLQEMLKNGYNLGGEKSGHIIFLDYNRTGDGVLTAIQLVAIISRNKQALSQLAGVMKPWPQLLANVSVKDKNWQGNSKIECAINSAENELGAEGRVFVRASGTEPLIRIMLEGRDQNLLNRLEEQLVELISAELN